MVYSILPKNFTTTMVPQVELFLFVFWENWIHQKDISKLTGIEVDPNISSRHTCVHSPCYRISDPHGHFKKYLQGHGGPMICSKVKSLTYLRTGRDWHEFFANSLKPNYFKKQCFSSSFLLTRSKYTSPKWPWSTQQASLKS